MSDAKDREIGTEQIRSLQVSREHSTVRSFLWMGAQYDWRRKLSVLFALFACSRVCT